MQVAVIGAGYVGLIQAVGLATIGHDVALAEADPAKVAKIRAGEPPIYEQGLAELLSGAVDSGSLTVFQSNADAVALADIVFLALPTPPLPDGSADVSILDKVVDELEPVLRPGTVLAIKSTVPVGTVARYLEFLGDRFFVVSNPEFLREGRAVADFLNPDRIVIGARRHDGAEKMVELYRPLDAPVLVTDPVSAEMVKYASNGYLAARVTYANSIANVCEAVGADVRDVLLGMGYDQRIGFSFLRPGPGYGGSCFPKDTRALAHIASEAGYPFTLMENVIAVNDAQHVRILDKVRSAAGSLQGATIGLWGLAFKAGTDDVRESPAAWLARRLVLEGASVQAFDPHARLDDVAMRGSALEAATGADVLLLATEWPEFARVNLRVLAGVMKGKVVVDARNLLDPVGVRSVGLEYVGVGR
ncbi:MAG: UDP-glucose/GDP-mannose dehydrogenase family protein [Acidimicrobiia bacterium]|nr:UDP-glucose/GDP-mannose dehydrogenase family protein [Acidimicrobiia bacterium]